MFKTLFSNRLFIGGVLILLVCAAVSVYFLRRDTPETPIKIYKPVETEQPPEPSNAEAPVEDTSQGGHVHEDGTFHAESHKTPEPVESPPVSDAGAVSVTSSVQIPDGITDPEVLAAWQRLDSIAKNPFQWGGRPSQRALELMDALTPMWVFDDPHDHGEELMMMLDMLAEERDPRSAELLLTYQLDSGVSGRPVKDALVAMGPASVPALIARLKPEDAAETSLSTIINLLPPIVEQHRSELGGIVDHIIIPRLEGIAAGPGYIGNISRARKTLERLKK